MALNDNDYVEILEFLRQLLQENRLGAVDERLVNQLRGSDGPYYALVDYLKLLSAEASLRTDDQLRTVLARFRGVVATESGEPIQGIRVAFSETEGRVFQSDHMDLESDPEAQRLVRVLHQLIDDLNRDRNQQSNAEGEE
jgi:hypothetical protein